MYSEWSNYFTLCASRVVISRCLFWLLKLVSGPKMHLFLYLLPSMVRGWLTSLPQMAHDFFSPLIFHQCWNMRSQISREFQNSPLLGTMSRIWTQNRVYAVSVEINSTGVFLTKTKEHVFLSFLQKPHVRSSKESISLGLAQWTHEA